MKKNRLKLFLVLVAICIPLAANAQPKHIAGPWTFTTEPCVFFDECDEVATINKDLLAKLTGGTLTEAKLLKTPPAPGDRTPRPSLKTTNSISAGMPILSIPSENLQFSRITSAT